MLAVLCGREEKPRVDFLLPREDCPVREQRFDSAETFLFSVLRLPRSRFRHNGRRPGQIVCPNSDSVCPNSDKIYLTVMTFRFLLLFFAY